MRLQITINVRYTSALIPQLVIGNQLQSAGEASLFKDVAGVELDCTLGNIQSAGNLRIGHALNDKVKNLLFSRRQAEAAHILHLPVLLSLLRACTGIVQLLIQQKEKHDYQHEHRAGKDNQRRTGEHAGAQRAHRLSKAARQKPEYSKGGQPGLAGYIRENNDAVYRPEA